MNFNQVIVGGNLTRDPEVRFGPSGDAIVKFGMACNRTWKGADGEKRSKATFVDVTMFGKRGEAFARFHRKGQSAFVIGRLEMDAWDDKATGARRTKLHVVAEAWEFVGSAKQSEAEPIEGSAPAEAADQGVDETPF